MSVFWASGCVGVGLRGERWLGVVQLAGAGLCEVRRCNWLLGQGGAVLRWVVVYLSQACLLERLYLLVREFVVGVFPVVVSLRVLRFFGLRDAGGSRCGSLSGEWFGCVAPGCWFVSCGGFLVDGGVGVSEGRNGRKLGRLVRGVLCVVAFVSGW